MGSRAGRMILGWMLPGDLRALKYLCQSVPTCGIIVEIGSYMGKSAVCFAENSKPTVNIYCIDTFDEERIVNHKYDEESCKLYDLPFNGTYNLHELFLENTKGYSNIHMIRGYSPQEIQYDKGPIDLLFLDASHTNPNDLENLSYFMRFMSDEATIAGHDYDPVKYPDVVENVHALEQLFETEAIFFDDSSIWAIRV